MKKNILPKIMVLSMIFFLLVSSFGRNNIVMSKSRSKYVASEIVKEYNKDKTIIDKLEEDEVNSWTKEMSSYLTLINQSQGYTEQDKKITKEILSALRERKAEFNQSNLSEKEKKSVDDRLIDAINKKDATKCNKILTEEMDLAARQKFKKEHPKAYKNYIKMLEDEGDGEDYIKQQKLLFEKKQQEDYSQIEKEQSGNSVSNSIYQLPSKDETGSSSSSLDDMIGDADSFLNKGDSEHITTSSLQEFSNTFYNILLTIGIIAAVIAGMVIGIKFMMGGAEEKANIKEILIPYVVGCAVVFGSFAIWKLAVTILSQI